MLNSIILMAPPSGGAGGGGVTNIIFFGLIIVVFYFFMIRPQTQKAKKEKEFKEGLKKGDRIVTIGGVHGKIVDVAEKTFVIEVADGVKVKVEKTAISMDVTKANQAPVNA